MPEVGAKPEAAKVLPADTASSVAQRALAIASFVLGACALWLDWAAAIIGLGIAAITFSLISIAAWRVQRAYRGLAITGLVIGLFCFVSAILWLNGAVPASFMSGR